MWITRDFLWMNCGQVPSYPQARVVHNSIHRFIHGFYPSYPQVYPQVSLHANVTNCLNSPSIAVFIHSLEHLSTGSVDKWPRLWKVSDDLSTERRRPVDRLWTEYTFNAYFVLQSPIPGGGGWGHLLLLICWVISCIWEKTSRSLFMRLAIFAVACITVEWSRPPKAFPILGSDSSVSSRERYMATCLG